MMKRPIWNYQFLAATLMLAGSLLFAGCGQRETRVEAGIRDQILHLGNGTEPQDIDPHLVTGVPEHKIIMALMEGLVSEDPKTLAPRPGVAERWEISDDGLVYTFHFRPNARWSNGDPVTAHDFVRAYQRMLSPTLGGYYSYMLYDMVNAEAFNKGEQGDFSQVGVKALDDRTLEISLSHPAPYFLQLIMHYSWFPVHIPTVERHGPIDRPGNRWTRPGNFVGNGPFNLKHWRINQVLVVEKSPTYWDADQVRLQEIHFYPIDNEDTEERAFRSGQLHYVYEMPLSKVRTYKERHPDLIHIDPYLGTYFYRLNVTKKPLDDKRVRRALALAIDRESLVQNVTMGEQIPAYHFTPPNTGGYNARARFEGDIAVAKRLLEEAGYPDGKGLPSIEILYNTAERHRIIAEAIQQMWRQHLNVNATLVNQEWKVYLDSSRNLNYQVSRAGWIGDYVDPKSFLDMFVTGGGQNQTGFSHLEYDQLIEQANETKDAQERFEIFQQAEAILLEELPIIPIFFYTRVYLLHPSVKGWHSNILDTHPYKYVYLE